MSLYGRQKASSFDYQAALTHTDLTATAASTEATDCAPFVEFMLDVIYQTLLSPAPDGNLGKDLGKELSKNQKAIIRLLLDNPRMTLKEMAEHLAVSTTTI